MGRHLIFLILTTLLMSIVWPVAASEIYHWVDEQGVNHYSQSPPPAASGEVETLDVDGSQPASYDPNEDRYNVAAQAEAMQAYRDQLAESRKNRQLAQQQQTPDTTVIYYPQEQSYGEILYPPAYRPRPPHPHPRPPGGRPERPGNLPADPPPASRPFRPR